jgi:DNA-directed RNA polymerase specialized sigma24 family protein
MKRTNKERAESDQLGEAIVRMTRALVTRAADGDTFALEQLARIERLTAHATPLAASLMNEGGTWGAYSYTELAAVLGISRQAVRQRAVAARGADSQARMHVGIGHVLMPGHTKRGCASCNAPAAELVNA